jgi:hypothetical protein
MAKKTRPSKKTPLIPRGVRSPRGYFSKSGAIMKNGGKKGGCK